MHYRRGSRAKKKKEALQTPCRRGAKVSPERRDDGSVTPKTTRGSLCVEHMSGGNEERVRYQNGGAGNGGFEHGGGISAVNRPQCA